MSKYILNEHGEPVMEPDLMKWWKWLQALDNRRIAKTECGPYVISTLFLGLDHAFGGGPPILWESMAFLKKDWDAKCTLGQIKPLPDQDCDRCSGSREQALAMHQSMVNKMSAIVEP